MELSDLFLQHGTVVEKSAKEFVFRQGESDSFIYFVKTGLLKATYLSSDGKEYVKSFLAEGDNISSLVSSHAKQPCPFNLVCIEPCTLIKLPFDSVFTMSLNDQTLSEIAISYLLQLVIKKEQREYEFLCLSAQDRLEQLEERLPNIIRRVTQADIARYLGITPVALSRMRKQSRQNA